MNEVIVSTVGVFFSGIALGLAIGAITGMGKGYYDAQKEAASERQAEAPPTSSLDCKGHTS